MDADAQAAALALTFSLSFQAITRSGRVTTRQSLLEHALDAGRLLLDKSPSQAETIAANPTWRRLCKEYLAHTRLTPEYTYGRLRLLGVKHWDSPEALAINMELLLTRLLDQESFSSRGRVIRHMIADCEREAVERSSSCDHEYMRFLEDLHDCVTGALVRQREAIDQAHALSERLTQRNDERQR